MVEDGAVVALKITGIIILLVLFILVFAFTIYWAIADDSPNIKLFTPSKNRIRI